MLRLTRGIDRSIGEKYRDRELDPQAVFDVRFRSDLSSKQQLDVTPPELGGLFAAAVRAIGTVLGGAVRGVLGLQSRDDNVSERLRALPRITI